MSLDLKILPAYNQRSDWSHDLLSFHRDFDLFDKITEVSDKFGIPVIDGGICSYTSSDDNYEEPHYGDTEKDKCGILKYVTANHIKDVLNGHDPEYWRNRAITAYINELPDDLPVYLYWC